jgi:NAD(P)-dependent dehydrogenase (short-subunit alcohol dehydrogenase family)
MTSEPTIRKLFDLDGRTALVTGATGRLGTSMARALSEAGARVIVTSRDEGRAKEVAATLRSLGTAAHLGLELDQLDENSIQRAFATAVDRCDTIHVLVNCAHEHVNSDLTDCSSVEFNEQLANVTGYFLMARLLRDHAVERKVPASIVMIASMYGLVGSYPDVYEQISPASPVAYHAAKGGILQMTRHLAVYWAPDRVRVNAISPGPFPGSNAPAELKTRLSTKLPMQRMGEPHELKGAVVFLASDASSYVTGHNLVVDGGWTAW